MKDISGYELSKGNFVQIRLGNDWVPGIVHEIEEGGVMLNSNQMTPPKLFILFEYMMPVMPKGSNQIMVRRIPHPEKEYIAARGN